jgi:hypothetical protein
MRVVAINALSMSVVRTKTDSPTLIHSMSIIIVPDGMAMLLTGLGFYVVSSRSRVVTMTGITPHLMVRAVACFGVPCKEHPWNYTTSIIISMRRMAIIAVAMVHIGRSWRGKTGPLHILIGVMRRVNVPVLSLIEAVPPVSRPEAKIKGVVAGIAKIIHILSIVVHEKIEDPVT